MPYVRESRECYIFDDFDYDKRSFYLKRLGLGARLVGDIIKFKLTEDSRKFLNELGIEGFEEVNDSSTNQIVDIKSKTTPFDHQKEVFEQIKDRLAFGIEWEMGLGKTKLAIDIALYKYKKGEIDVVLIIAPKGVHFNWIYNEIPCHVEGDQYLARAWNNNKKDYGTDGIFEYKGLVFFAMNYNAIITKNGNNYLHSLLNTRKVLLILDESHYIKGPDSSRTKELLRLHGMSKCRLIMTGTAMTNTPLDLWSQYRFLSTKIITENYYIFRNKYAIFRPMQIGGSSFNQLVGYKNLEDLKKVLEPHRSVLTKKDVLNLPDKIYMTREYELDKTTRKMYDDLVKNYVTETGEDTVSVQIALTKLLRLQQFCCGFFISDDEKKTKNIQESERLSILMEILEGIDSKVIIWSTFRKSIGDIHETIEEKYGEGTSAIYFGDTSSETRLDIVKRFQDPNDKLRFFIGNPQAGGTGITLTEASYVIYFNNSFNLAQRLQSEDRAHRIGQKKNVTYIDLVASHTVDGKILKALKDKTELATIVGSGNFKNWLVS